MKGIGVNRVFVILETGYTFLTNEKSFLKIYDSSISSVSRNDISVDGPILSILGETGPFRLFLRPKTSST